MAYTTIDKSTDYFNTKLYTGNATDGTAITGVGFRPDWVWIKNTTDSEQHRVQDAVRGATKVIKPSGNGAEETVSNHVQSFDSDGFTLGIDNAVNGNTDSMVSWNWLAGGTAPSQTYTVKVVSDSGNKYRFDDFGTSAVTLDLQEGGTYTFDQSDSSNSGHPLRFSTTSDGTHGGGSEFTTNVTTTGTPGNSGAKTVITLGSGVATLYYYCTQHSGMGGQANTNSTFGSSNFSGSIQSTVSAGTTQGFSIVKYTGNATSGATVGHGLGVSPNLIIIKKTSTTEDWVVQDSVNGYANRMLLNYNLASASHGTDFIYAVTSSTWQMYTNGSVNGSGGTYIAYCFNSVKGYSKIGSYTGNANADGTFVYTGFKPAFVILKDTDSNNHWYLLDNKRNPINKVDNFLKADVSDEFTGAYTFCDFVSNGFKIRGSASTFNSSNSFLYIAFAESPFVNSKGVPTNAR
jgi:hypothetical protein|tara:strand:+ start:1401 stop:2780 length:1380 start_codon:yes stop_codon:yes gene_type:complete